MWTSYTQQHTSFVVLSTRHANADRTKREEREKEKDKRLRDKEIKRRSMRRLIDWETMRFDSVDLEYEYEILPSSVIDRTAMILLNLKKEPITTTSSSSPLKDEDEDISPSICDCMLCERGTPIILSKCHTWAWIMRVVFFALKHRYPKKKFLSLKNDIYEYMLNHWSALGLDKKRMFLSLFFLFSFLSLS